MVVLSPVAPVPIGSTLPAVFPLSAAVPVVPATPLSQVTGGGIQSKLVEPVVVLSPVAPVPIGSTLPAVFPLSAAVRSSPSYTIIAGNRWRNTV